MLQPGAIHLQNWVQAFNLNRVCTSLARVWVRFIDLPMEYWQPGILEAMASAFGTLIRIDDRTLHRRIVHYARVLVEIDMKVDLIEKIMYRRAGICSFANLIFERLPKFCRGCGIVGHTTTTCSWGRKHKTEVNTCRGHSSTRLRPRSSTSRNRRSSSRRRESSTPREQADHTDTPPHTNGVFNHEDVDDVLHVDPMHGQSANKILALPPISTKNTFDALNVGGFEGSSSESTTLTHSKDAMQISPCTTQAQVVHDSDTTQGPPTLPRGRGSAIQLLLAKLPGSGKVIREVSVPTGASINAFLKGAMGNTLPTPRRSLNSVVGDVAKSAQESFTVGAVQEQHLVAKESWADMVENEDAKSWADMVEKEDAKKPPKHGSKAKR
ncbi:hypothetical protein ACS0TY_003475 [Phlomoides rotata]